MAFSLQFAFNAAGPMQVSLLATPGIVTDLTPITVNPGTDTLSVQLSWPPGYNQPMQMWLLLTDPLTGEQCIFPFSINDPGCDGTHNRMAAPKTGLSVWPVPADDALYVLSTGDGESEQAELSLYDLSGRKRISTELISGQSLRISTLGLAEGMYLLVIRNGNAEGETRKVIIRH